MPAMQGGAPQEVIDAIEEEMVNGDRFDDFSEALEHCTRYTLANKYGRDV